MKEYHCYIHDSATCTNYYAGTFLTYESAQIFVMKWIQQKVPKQSIKLFQQLKIYDNTIAQAYISNTTKHIFSSYIGKVLTHFYPCKRAVLK